MKKAILLGIILFGSWACVTFTPAPPQPTLVIARTTAAKTRGIIFCSASTIAVLPKPQAVSPAAIAPWWLAIR